MAASLFLCLSGFILVECMGLQSPARWERGIKIDGKGRAERMLKQRVKFAISL